MSRNVQTNVQSCSLALNVDDPVTGLDSGLKASGFLGVGDMNKAVPVVIRLLPKKAKRSRRRRFLDVF